MLAETTPTEVVTIEDIDDIKRSRDSGIGCGIEQRDLDDLKSPLTSGTGQTGKIDYSRLLDKSVVRGKTAIVSDAAKGLGLGIATDLAANGAKVALCDGDVETGETAAADLTNKGYDVKFFKTESSSWDSQAAMFKDVLAWSDDQLDIVVTSPGIVTTNLLMSILPKHSKSEGGPQKPPTEVFEMDLLGVYYTTSLALFYFNQLHSNRRTFEFPPQLRPQLLFICSMAGYDGLEFGTDYAAAKHGVRAIWKTTRTPRPSMAQYQANMLVPTYNRSTMLRRRENDGRKHNTETRDIADSVEGAMRCICDITVEKRALCCVQGSAGEPGSENFDVSDDFVDFNGAKELMDRAEEVWMPSSMQLSEDAPCAFQ